MTIAKDVGYARKYAHSTLLIWFPKQEVIRGGSKGPNRELRRS